MAADIIARSDRLAPCAEAELTRRAHDLRWRARSGEPLDRLLPDAYALVREAAHRVLDQQHYPVQLMGGICLYEGGLAEMQTGEGKTLTATLPVFLRALAGQGCHVITVNDYLAQRDAKLLRPLYALLGLTVSCIQTDDKPDQRRDAYLADITYATGREVGFDFLRDRLKQTDTDPASRADRVFPETDSSSRGVQRGLHFALVDEADSVLIDDAGTPLIISLDDAPSQATIVLNAWCCAVIGKLRNGVDYHQEEQNRSIELTSAGCRKVSLWPKPAASGTLDAEKLYHAVEQALLAHIMFQEGQDYVVKDGEIQIIDESTGRPLDGRKWQDGLHQAIEAKEGVELSSETGGAATITVQGFFRQYRHLAGMSGTAIAATREFRKVYRLGVTAIPTHRPARRTALPPRIFQTLSGKYKALAREVCRLQSEQRAVLIGTPSVRASNLLGEVLGSLNIEACILNALKLDEEDKIVEQAGLPGRVTIATNMAGRGTDIKLDPGVRQRGGLVVLATEVHSSRRIDRQLIGRCARQGDPGQYQFWLSLEDELFRDVPRRILLEWGHTAVPDQQGELPRSWIRIFQRVQRQIEQHEARQRKHLLAQNLDRERRWRAMGLDPCLELTE